VASGVKLMVNRSAISGHAATGIVVGAGAEVNVDNSVVSGNATGISNSGTIRLANTDISFNATGITGASLSFGNNRISGNTAPGTAPTLIAPAGTNPAGQQ